MARIGISVTFCNQPEVSTTSGSIVMAQTVVLMFLMTLTYVLLIVTQSRHEVLESPLRSFIGIHHVLIGHMTAVKVLKNALCFIMGYLVDMAICVTLF